MRSHRVWTLVAALAVLAVPASAGEVDIYGSHWNTDQADESLGGGVTVTFPTGPVGIELRAAHYQELSNEPFDNVFDDDPVFEDGIQATPVEGGLRVNFGPETMKARPYAAGGAGYYFLDSDFGEVDDEFGWYAALGSNFGNGKGAEFVAEVNYRKVEGSVAVDPEEVSDIDDIDFQSDVELDLSGVGVNLGVSVKW
jgi:hypothetical protein